MTKIPKVVCRGCGVVFGVKSFTIHRPDCLPKQPGDRFFASGKAFREKPPQPSELDAPPIRVVKIVFKWFTSPPAPMLLSDAFDMLEKGKLYRADNSLKVFFIADETELMLEGNEIERLLHKARIAGARL